LPLLVEVVPSAQVTLAELADVPAAGAAAPADAVDPPSFLTPPWCEQAPLPVALDVVPSAHVTGAELVSALAGSQAKASSSAADISVSFFMVRFPLSATQLARSIPGRPGPRSARARRQRSRSPGPRSMADGAFSADPRAAKLSA
jgi:hypothetical protein